MTFFDTSVFVAASVTGHISHHQCLARIATMQKDGSACSTHTFAELYSALTRFPRDQRVPPLRAVEIARSLASRVKSISLTSEEYFHTLDNAAAKGLSGGIIYDALLMACARKSGAKRIYTLNPSHFQLAAPDLASLVRVP